jgi:amidophosphoribosyltransferase
MCGVFGVVLPPGGDQSAAALASLGLFALQHRGQESAGVAVSDGEQLMLYKDLGMIASVLDERRLPSLRGGLAIAHCRYSTTGSTIWENAQPTFRLGPRRALAIGHNGNLVNTRELLDQLVGGRGRLPASTDTELLTALLADEPAADTVDALVRVLPRVHGAFSLVILDERRVIGVRDPFGFRPLVLGRLPARIRPRLPPGRACGATTRATTRPRAGSSRARRPASTSSAPSSSATWNPGRSSSWRRAVRRSPSGTPRRARPCASSS